MHPQQKLYSGALIAVKYALFVKCIVKRESGQKASGMEMHGKAIEKDNEI